MSPPPTPPRRTPHFGDLTVMSLLISSLVLLVAYIAIRPRFSHGRLLVDQLHDLTAEEVSLLPEGTIPVVLGRGLGENNRGFKIQADAVYFRKAGKFDAMCGQHCFVGGHHMLARRKGRLHRLCGDPAVPAYQFYKYINVI